MKKLSKFIQKIIFIELIILFTIFNIKVQAVYDFETEEKNVADECLADAKTIAEGRDISYSAALKTVQELVLDKNNDYLEKTLGRKPSDDYREQLSDFIQAKINAETTGEVTAPTGLTEQQKQSIAKEIRQWMNSNKNSSNYKELLQNKLNANDWDTEEENTYAKRLYQTEYDRVVASEATDAAYKSGLNQTELNAEIEKCDREIARLNQMPGSYRENGKTKQQLLAEQRALKQKYEEDLGTAVKEEATSEITGKLGQANASSSHTPDEVIDEADGFISKGQSEGSKINGEALKDASNTLYNILLIIGIFLAVAIGMYLGIKFMLSSAEDRAKVKESLVPYIAGCVVIFGAFIIWKLAITLLSNLA